MRRHLPHPAQDERGFILVGVVTFMLALTILGLSLFALSSYEAQFFVASEAREQSLQNSESGMELVKTLMAAPGARLEDAHRAEGQFGITHAYAYQWRSGLPTDTSSTGPVNRDSSLVVVVAAKSGGVERALLAQFIPGMVENPYQRLLASGQGIMVDTENSTDPSTVQLSGRVWHPVNSDADTAWTNNLDWNSGRPIQRGMPPLPDARSLVDARVGFASQAGSDFNDANDYQMFFPGSKTPGSLTPTFFRSPDIRPSIAGETGDAEYPKYTFYIAANLTISVRGVAVWLLPGGACFKDQVILNRLDNSVPSTLVIVAEPGSDANRGICFKGGLKVTDNDLHVFLVSNGDISVIHHNDDDNSNDAQNLSIVAGGHIELGGPEGSKAFKLSYDPSSMDALADQLLAQQALPQVFGGTGTGFLAVRPSWVEITPR
jgi:hypothetical protein